MKREPPSPIPLARLLALAYRQLIDELHVRLAALGYADVRPAFGYVLLALREQPTTGADIALLLGVTKQAASKLIDVMERGGYVRRKAHGNDARAKTIAITARGRKVLVTVESIYRGLEVEWADATSKERMEALRADLRTVVEVAHGGQLPAVRPTR
ncbi:MAG: winged helix-turn-helix transcriptional regulator [Gemmatimonadaceae bacterium]|nr:winged helix-turn-helix transcriptional regulator [Gemmatimonadaceae bacterium]